MSRWLLLFFSGFIFTHCDKTPPPQPVMDPFTPPAIHDLVIYELFPRSFSAEGSLAAITAQLDTLQRLGINCIWMMPIYPVGVEKRIPPLGSPYSIRNFKAIDPSYGTAEDLRSLIDAAHQRGIAIILDFVANHTAWDHPWISSHPEMYTQDAQGNIVHPPGTNWQDVADLNFNHLPTRDSMQAAMQWWVDNFNIDGFRCDYADGVPVDFWQNTLQALEEKRPLIMLAEGENRALLATSGFDIAFSWGFYSRLAEVFAGQRVAASAAGWVRAENLNDPPGTYRLRMLTNHDFVSFEDLPIAVYQTYNGIKAAAVAHTYLPGVPMLYNGQEVGSQQRLNLFDDIPINWSDPRGFRAFYTTVYDFYQKFEELRTGDYAYYNASPEVMLFERMGADSSLIAINLRDTTVTVPRPNHYRQQVLKDWFTNSFKDGDSLTLGPYRYMLLKR